jgi:hypothetical protein
MQNARIALIAILLLTGCASRDGTSLNWPTVHASPPPPKRNGIAELRHLAKTRGLHWRIFCTIQDDPSEKFLAQLCVEDCDILYAEDGAKGDWAEFGATQGGAAEKVVDRVVFGEHMREPMHKSNWKGKQCTTPTISDKTEGN